MMKRIQKIISLLFLFVSFVLNNSLIVFADEYTEYEQQKDIGPITGIIACIVLVVVAYGVYHLMYDGSSTVIIGTREDLAHERGARLAVPLLCGGAAAGIVIKIINILKTIFIVLIIIAVIVVLIVIVYNFINKKRTPEESNDVSISDRNVVDEMEYTTDKALENNNSMASDIVNTPRIATPDVNRVEDLLKSKYVDIFKNTNNKNCEFGIPVLECEALVNVRGAFGIPPTEKVYLINNSAILSNWTKGFAICETGIYSRVKHKKYISWEEFKKKKVKNEIYIYIGEDEYTVFDDDLQKKIYELLCDIQALL